jgi:hypothetical protein
MATIACVRTGGARFGPCIAANASGEYGHLFAAEKPRDPGPPPSICPTQWCSPWPRQHIGTGAAAVSPIGRGATSVATTSNKNAE